MLNPNNASNPPPYFDCNADGFVSPLDVLVVINFINRRGSGEGEAYSQVVALATPIINPSPVTERPLQSRREELQRRIELYDIDRSFVSYVNTGVSRAQNSRMLKSGYASKYLNPKIYEVSELEPLRFPLQNVLNFCELLALLMSILDITASVAEEWGRLLSRRAG